MRATDHAPDNDDFFYIIGKNTENIDFFHKVGDNGGN